MKNWLPINRSQQDLLPPSVDELLPQGHLARYVVEVVESLGLSAFLSKYDQRARGSHPYHPSLLISLLIYGSATGVMSSRKIERACHFDLAFRFIASHHRPDHDTIASFRRRHLKELGVIFVDVLLIAKEMGFTRMGVVTIDSTKMKANASRHSAVSLQRANESKERLEAEVEELLKKGEEADNAPSPEGLDIPAEIALRRKRADALSQAIVAIHARKAKAEAEAYEEALEKNAREAEDAVRNRKKIPPIPEPPTGGPKSNDQHNFTDPDSRIMPDKGGFTQAYSALASVDAESMLIVGQHISQRANDKKEFLPALRSIPSKLGRPAAAALDAGFASAENFNVPDIDVYIAPGRVRKRRTVEDLFQPPVTGPPPPGATPSEIMRHKLTTEKGKAIYRLRKMTVAPVFGIIKSAMGFRQFHLRGLEKVQGEWGMVCLAYNMRRLWKLAAEK